jgi:opacity protein-like surface antigen
MKKFGSLSILLALIPMAVTANEGRFNGPYGSLGLGISSQTLKRESLTAINVPAVPYYIPVSQNAVGTGAPVAATLNLGYSNVFNKFYSAIEARIGIQPLKSTQSFALVANVGGAPTTTINSTTIVKSSHENYAFLLKPGMIYRSNTIFYGVVGAEVRKLKISTKASDLQNFGGPIATSNEVSNKTAHKIGLVLGFGVEVSMTDAIGLGLEYLHAEYRTVKTSASVPFYLGGAIMPGSSLSVENKLKLRTDTLFLKMTYRF